MSALFLSVTMLSALFRPALSAPVPAPAMLVPARPAPKPALTEKPAPKPLGAKDVQDDDTEEVEGCG